MLTPELIQEFAPRAHKDYVRSLTSDKGWSTMEKYGIVKSEEALAGFLANCLHETGGFVILRESLNYKTPKRLRQVWPSRFGKKSDTELQKLCGNEKLLASTVYNGRMGNRPGTDDGYTFRGAGYLQTTGREDFIKYGKLVGIDFSKDPPPSTDDTDALLVMAAAEWQAGRCNELCKAGNFAGACAVINVGSASKVGSVVGLGERQTWYKQVMHAFSEYENILESPIPPAPPAPAAPAPGAPAPGAPAPGAPAPGAPAPGAAAPMPTGTDTQAPAPTPAAPGQPGAATEGADVGATRGLGIRPRLRHKPVSRAPQQHHWYDWFVGWFKSKPQPLEIPKVVLHPELTDLGDDAGDPSYRHFTDRDGD